MTRRAEAALGGIEIDVRVEDGEWRRALPRCREIARRAAEAAARDSAGNGTAEISVLLAGDGRVRDLNRAYRGLDTPTNVLAFANDAEPAAPGASRLLGDVVVACGTACREAAAGGIGLSDHLSHLVVHGVLHLLGYDHETESDAETMERREAVVLAGLGIADPHTGRGGGKPRPVRES